MKANVSANEAARIAAGLFDGLEQKELELAREPTKGDAAGIVVGDCHSQTVDGFAVNGADARHAHSHFRALSHVIAPSLNAQFGMQLWPVRPTMAVCPEEEVDQLLHVRDGLGDTAGELEQ